MDATPGVEVFVPLAKNLAVEHGFRHPIHLPSCLSVFNEESLYLFSGSRDTVDVVAEAPPFADIRNLSALALDLTSTMPEPAASQGVEGDLRVDLKLVPTSGSWQRVHGVAIPWKRVEWLRQLVYTLPPRLLRDTRVHVGKERIVILGETGIESIPIGTLLCQKSDAVLVAAGYDFIPKVTAELLQTILGIEPGEIFIFEPGMSAPYVIREAELKPLGIRAVAQLAAHRTEALAVPETVDVDVALRYHDLGAFPLWGLPGRRDGGKGQ